MTINIAALPGLQARRSLLRAVFRQPATKARSPVSTASRSECLRREMMAAGDLLIEALRLEAAVSNVDATQNGDEALEQYRWRRKTMEVRAQDYVAAVARWRQDVCRTFQE